jgi:hypothetical protein
MTDIKSPFWRWTKGLLFVVLGLLALIIVTLISRDPMVILAAMIAVWAFCRVH